MSSNSCSSCNSSSCSYSKKNPNETQEQFDKRQKIGLTLCNIKHVFLVLSGKGGVGKSTVSTNIAYSLANMGFQTGLLDIDFHGPSIPTMLGMSGLGSKDIHMNMGKFMPPEVFPGFKVMSLGFLLESPEQPVIWRGPMKTGIINQLIGDVEWGELDVLVVDCPPGTGDEPLSIAQTIPDADGAIIVTTPQQVAIADVRRSVSFCKKLDLPIAGIVENMSGFKCPDCGKEVSLFKQGGGEKLAKETGVKFLGKVPITPEIVESTDDGKSYIDNFKDSDAALAFKSISEELAKSMGIEKKLNQ